MNSRISVLLLVCFLVSIPLSQSTFAQKQEANKTLMKSSTFTGLKLRGLGPAHRSGRVSSVVKDPTNKNIWYVGVASGNIWKTVNNGTTWTPIFDRYGSYSIGCLAIDQKNPYVLWAGTGENTSQRSVAYGDGVYKSLDGGKSWKNVGLKESYNIGKIVIDPRDSNVVYVAAMGNLWASGGDRGLYKTIDGGASWTRVLEISENTGISEVVLDPSNPDIVYTASYQRRRHVGILVAGGPESRIYKSSDAGKTWKMLTNGLPGGDVGRTGLAVSPQKPNVVYALIAATDGNSGFYRSEDYGESWVKKSDYICVDPQYYMEIFPDPHHFDHVYSNDVVVHHTDDGGATFERVNTRWKHVDNHEILFDADDPDYLLFGTDGGIYETWDRGKTWRYFDNLPITQYYRVGIDNSYPFYYLYGGTQDNGSMGGPSRTTTVHGITNHDWFNTIGGDGYQVRVDPENPNILYTEFQYGGLVRFDRTTGERVDIQPQPGSGEPPIKLHWDSPLLISPHSNTRIYFGGNVLFRSDDRGDTWQVISPDLTAGIDRNKREVMGRVWSVDAVWKNVFTSWLGNMVALDESILVEGLIYCGMDDGLIQVTEDGGQNWRAISEFPGVPANTYVTDVTASQHDADTVYATFNNHKEGDFKPYVLKSTDRGRTWQSITGGVPDRHITWSIVEDHVNPNMLFLGTEFGLFFTVDGGGNWIQLKGNVPTILFRDLEIQKRENDLVCATFGRGFYILDDYSPLRDISEEKLAEESILFPVKKAWMYTLSNPLSGGEKAALGDGFFTAPNPPYGAVFTYYLKDSLKTKRSIRRAEELKRQAEGEPNYYPSWQELRSEDNEWKPAIVLTVRDSERNIVRRLTGPTSAGFHRISWDLRYSLPRSSGSGRSRSAQYALPGKYTVGLAKLVDGEFIELAGPVEFETVSLGRASLPDGLTEEQQEFQQKTLRLVRAASAASRVVEDLIKRVDIIRNALLESRGTVAPLMADLRKIELEVLDIDRLLHGDDTVDKHFEPTAPSIIARINRVVRGFWMAAKTTTTHKRNYEIASSEFELIYNRLKTLLETDLKTLEQQMENINAPWTPGRPLPTWTKEVP